MTTPIDERLTTAREAEAFIPPLREFVGCKSLLAKLQSWTLRPIMNDGNLLVEGEPGTGKTAALLAYFREQFRNPYFFREQHDPQRQLDKANGRHGKSIDELREWQSIPPRMIYFKQINGATDSPDVIRSKLQELQYALNADHRVLLVDELGELYWRGLEESLRPILTESETTVYATAQNFHSKRKTDTAAETDQRLSALLRRFSHRETTELPTEADHLRFLVYLIKEWGLKVDSADTLRLLVDKSDGIVGWSKRIMIRAIDEPGRKLTRALVEEGDVDPR
jgi:hypothetical protein